MDFSPGALAATFLVGAVGFVLFVYGKRQVRPPQIAVGLALMVYPYFVTGVGWILGVGAALLAALWLALRAGM